MEQSSEQVLLPFIHGLQSSTAPTAFVPRGTGISEIRKKETKKNSNKEKKAEKEKNKKETKLMKKKRKQKKRRRK